MYGTGLFAIVPTPNFSAQTETHIPTIAGRNENLSSTIDTIKLLLSDEYGNFRLSLQNYVVSSLYDEVETEDLPPKHRFSSFKARLGEQYDYSLKEVLTNCSFMC